MKKIRIALLAVAAFCVHPVSAFAQDEGEEVAGEEAAEGGEEDAEEGAEESAEEIGAEEGAEEIDAADEQLEESPDEEPLEPIEGEGGLGGICEIDPEACPELDFDKEAARDLGEQLYAVQQVYVLRNGRFELSPFWGFTMNDQFVSHSAPGMALNFWITNVLAIGVNGSYFEPFNSDSQFNFETRRAARVGVPLTEYNWGAALNFTYSPFMGKFAGFGDFIFQYDAYVVGGVGALSTRPIPVIDPDNRDFQYETGVAFNAGFGLHVFFNRWFAVTMEIRDYIFNDQLENTEIADNVQDQASEATWFGGKKLTNNVQAQIGVSVLIPFSFEYRLPK